MHATAVPATAVTEQPELDRIREADGPDEEAPVIMRPVIHVVARATTDTMYGPGATVGEIMRRAAEIRAMGHATATRWLRDDRREIIGIELSTYEAR